MYRIISLCLALTLLPISRAGIAAEAEPNGAPNPYARFWKDPAFVKSFMGSYGIVSEVEPRLGAEEQEFYLGLRPLLEEDPAKAVQLLSKRLSPDSSAQLNFLLGSLHYQLGRPEQARTEFEAAVAKFPTFRRAHKNLGFALAQSGEFQEAIIHLTKTIELGGGDSSVFGLLGYAYLNLEQHLPAMAAYQNAVLHDGANLDWKMGLIKTQVATGNYTAAGELLRDLLAKYPDQATLWTLQAGLHLQMDQPSDAAIHYEVVRRLGKADANTLRLLGDLYMSLDMRDLALPVYLEGIRMNPEASATQGIRAAEILVTQGAIEEAALLLDEVRAVAKTTLSPEQELQILKLEARVAIARDDAAGGAAILTKVLERDPMDGQALLLLADYHLGNGDREKADFRYELASRISGFEAEALVKRAQLLVQDQQYVKALEFLRRAQQIRPRDHVQRYLEKVETVARGVSR